MAGSPAILNRASLSNCSVSVYATISADMDARRHRLLTLPSATLECFAARFHALTNH